jgi:protein-disulfide isomerase
MANNEKWVNDRLNALAPPSEWKPDTASALGRVKERDRVYRKRRTQWMGSAMAASILALAVLLTPAKCAFGVCRTSVPAAPPAHIVEAEPTPPPAPPVQAKTQMAQVRPRAGAPAPAPKRTAAAVVVDAPAQRNFKESGDPNAPITCEIFTDYQCPHCATIFDQVVPMLRADYVQTGKMKFVHRDFPLPSHAYARLAARYANAAGLIGQYELVVNQIFRTQANWARNGDVDSQVAQVLSSAQMDQVRALVNNDGHLDDTVNADLAIVHQDNLNQTPTLVVTYKGKRQVLAPVPPYSLLKSYLDELLTK